MSAMLEVMALYLYTVGGAGVAALWPGSMIVTLIVDTWFVLFSTIIVPWWSCSV